MSKAKKIITIFILICLLAGIKCYATTGTVNAPSGLVLRESASKSAEPITTVSNNESVEIIETLDEWYKVKYGNNEGYLYKDYVVVKEEATTTENEPVEEKTETPTENVVVTEPIHTIYPTEATTLKAGKVYIMPSVSRTTRRRTKRRGRTTRRSYTRSNIWSKKRIYRCK